MQEIAKDIIQEAAGGDMKAFEEIYKAASGFVYSSALRITANASDAQEITQEVFLKVHKYLKSFQYRSSLKTWIYRITINTAINYSKKMKKEIPAYKEIENDTVAVGESADAARSIEESDNKRVLESLFSLLNPDQKACVIMREIEGLSYQEIAKALKLNINTVRTRLKRARQALMAMRKSEVIKHEL